MKLFRRFVMALMIVALITLVSSVLYSKGTITYLLYGNYGPDAVSGWPKNQKKEQHVAMTKEPLTYRVESSNELIYGNGIRLEPDGVNLLIVYSPLPENDDNYYLTSGLDPQDFPVFIFKYHSNLGLIGLGDHIVRRSEDAALMFSKMPLVD